MSTPGTASCIWNTTAAPTPTRPATSAGTVSTENHLARTEWLSAMSWLLGGEYGEEPIHEAWETLLRNQFHDIIPGSSIQEVYERLLEGVRGG